MTSANSGVNLLDKGTRCLLVQSKFFTSNFWNYKDACQLKGVKYPSIPLGLITAAALLPQQWEFKLVDENIESLLDEHFEWADIVCTSGLSAQRDAISFIIENSHHFHCPVVVGGADPTANPVYYKNADYLVSGEGEITIPMFVEDIEKGYKSGEYNSSEKADMTQSVIPRFDLLRIRDYLQMGVQYSRGCPFKCEFCDAIETYGRKVRTKKPEQMIMELQSLIDLGYRGYVDIVDDNFIGDKKSAKETLQMIKEWYNKNNNPFYFSTETTLDLAEETDILELMRELDFRYVYIGIETPEEYILKAIQKNQNLKDTIQNSTNKIHSYGINIFASFVLGFDHESSDIAQKLITCVQETGLNMVMLGKLEALPNTRLTKRLQSEGRYIASGRDNSMAISGREITHISHAYWCCSNGLNFVTTRPRINIIRDYITVLDYIYSPLNYFRRVIHSCLLMRPANNYVPGKIESVKMLYSFFLICLRLGFNKKTGYPFWKAIMTVLMKNPRAMETAVSLSVMFIHFHNQSEHMIDISQQEIENIDKDTEQKFSPVLPH